MTLKQYRKKFASLGGKARAQRLTKARRGEIAKAAAQARWGSKPVTP